MRFDVRLKAVDACECFIALLTFEWTFARVNLYGHTMFARRSVSTFVCYCNSTC